MPRKTKSLKKTDQQKSWARRRSTERPYAINERTLAKAFLIICEGANTEPAYFKAFPLGNAVVESYGLGRSKTALVEQVLKIIEIDEDAKLKEIWVVFDFDIKKDQVEQQKQDYNNAIELAERNGLKVAYANDSFELWFLLHYQIFDTQWTRHEYYEKLSVLWDCNYEKAGKAFDFCRKIYRRLQEDPAADQLAAIKRAGQLLDKQKEQQYADRNPCTTVHELVIELNQYL